MRVGEATDSAEPTISEIAQVAAGAQSADAPVRASERARLGGIRVHVGPLASTAAHAVGAEAYSVGNHIVFASGRYVPSTLAGRLLLAHELIHAVGPHEAIVRRQIGPPTLIETYRIAVREGRWSDAAEILNGFNRLDIDTELAALTDTQIALLHEGTLLNPGVGPDSQLGQMTDPSAPRASLPPPTPRSTSPVLPPPSPVATTLTIPTVADAVTTISSGAGVRDLSADAATQRRLMQIIQSGGPIPSGSKARVIGAAIVEVDGFAGAREIRAISSGETDVIGLGAPVFHAPTPETRTFTAAQNIGGSGVRGEFPGSHINDAEIKIFEYLAANMPPNATGRISILTVRSRGSAQTFEPIPACSSCTNALFQLAGRYRSVQVGSYAPVHPTGTVDLGSSGGSSTAQQQKVAASGGTTAQIGTPDLRGLEVGGPSARGTGIVAGVQIAFMGANFVLNLINDHVQERRAREALASLEAVLNERRRRNPSLGLLLIFYYSQVQAPEESLIRPGAVFGHIEHEFGRTRDEALATWRATPALRQGYSSNVSELTQEIWIPPAAPASPALLRTPFPSVGLARFAAGQTTLQDVDWGGITGFDDEGTTSLSDAASARLVILRVPAKLYFYNGGARYDVDIPVEQRTPHAGPSIPTVNLDPVIPGFDVHAAPLFPADDFTDALFATAHATYDNLGQLDHYTNFGKVRWARPENLDVDS
jgi:hypothetical protein